MLWLLHRFLLGAGRVDHANRLNGKAATDVASRPAAAGNSGAGCGIAFMAKASMPGRPEPRPDVAAAPATKKRHAARRCRWRSFGRGGPGVFFSPPLAAGDRHDR